MLPTAPFLENGVSASSPAEPQWTPPLDADALAHILDRVRAWDPLVVEAVFDDLEMAQGDQPPGADEADELASRLRSTVKQLSAIAVATLRLNELGSRVPGDSAAQFAAGVRAGPR